MGFLIIETIIVWGVVQYRDVPETKENKQQDKTARHLKQSGSSWSLKALG
jgi:hypothetical protein